MAVSIDITYEGELHCIAIHGPSRQRLTTDAPVDNGGKGAAFSPTDLMATALGTCVATIMGLVAQRRGLDLAGMRVHVIKEMIAVPTRRIGALAVTITLPPGKPITEADRAELQQAAHACPARKSLHPDIDVRIEFVWP